MVMSAHHQMVILIITTATLMTLLIITMDITGITIAIPTTMAITFTLNNCR